MLHDCNTINMEIKKQLGKKSQLTLEAENIFRIQLENLFHKMKIYFQGIMILPLICLLCLFVTYNAGPNQEIVQ